jgi:diguanylate cyclase (GGDEF)-like protein
MLATPVTDANVIGAVIKSASDKLRQQSEALVAAKKTLEQRVEDRTRELAAKSALLETTLANMDQGLTVIDADGFIRIFNSQAAELINLPVDYLATQPNIRDTIAFQTERGDFREVPDDVNLLIARHTLVPGQTLVNERENSDGRVMEVRTVPLNDGGLVRTYTDVTLRKHAERHLQYLARHDSLTGLPNRLYFRERMEQAIAYQRRHNLPFSILLIDIDHFKSINDLHGHAVGDALLMQVSDRLKSTLRMEDTVARLGGDEFAILQTGGGDGKGSAGLARRLIAVASTTYSIDNLNLEASISIGVATCPQHGCSSDEIMRKADTALYQAKRSGRDRFCQYEDFNVALAAG